MEVYSCLAIYVLLYSSLSKKVFDICFISIDMVRLYRISAKINRGLSGLIFLKNRLTRTGMALIL